MGYVAIRVNQEAIENAEALFYHLRTKGNSSAPTLDQVAQYFHLLVDRIMSEGSLYAPKLAALALLQSAGDTLESAFLLRAYRSTLSRLDYSLPVDTRNMQVIRRISAAFKDLPGGQLLGPSLDYSLRLLNFELLEEDTWRRYARSLIEGLERIVPIPENLPKLIDILRKEGLVVENVADRSFVDITREPLSLPAKRSAVLQSLSRGETGGLLLLAYSNMRGYGDIHPTVGELRVGYLKLEIPHPKGGTICVGEVKVTEAEVIARFTSERGEPRFSIGYGLCFGHNETKAICMAVLDNAIHFGTGKNPSEDQEFVLMHVDGVDSMGFANHYKLPHYVTFQSDLDRLRSMRSKDGKV
ncbi:MAG: carbon-phosphorus lyase [Acidobacteria bacterium]|jgi:alpha-D-ribose 1-methylphosphonate 5-triphosphate synthase subunit PhnI|nr:MAG: carbon-phosphorus lyase [Acidobacteriota bacterium]